MDEVERPSKGSNVGTLQTVLSLLAAKSFELAKDLLAGGSKAIFPVAEPSSDCRRPHEAQSES